MPDMPNLTSAAALILAAGKGVRMHSPHPKALQTILGSPMLTYELYAATPLFGGRIFIVAGYQAEEIHKNFPELPLILQPQQLGTGHAVQCAMEALEPYSHVLILNADTPLINSAWIVDFISRAGEADIAFASIELPDPGSYGRIVRENGQLRGIVEAKDFNPAIHGQENGEVNTGIWWLKMETLKSLLPLLDNSNKSHEYYITDLVKLGLKRGLDVRGIQCGENPDLLGINTPLELAAMEERLRVKIAAELLATGVIIHAPQLLRASPFARIEAGAEISGPCEIYGSCLIHSGAKIDSNCLIENSEIMPGAQIRSFSHISEARVGKNALVGPYARLRPGAVLEANAHVGNFVELKNAVLGEGAKANHLSYLGDARIGEGSNIGAGTITCNYDGQHKHHTEIGSRAFIGSNTALVAPVSIGADTVIGAGSVITHNVPDGEMGIARARQKNLRRRRR